MNGPGHNINLYKVMQAQAKYMKAIWLYAHGRRSHCKFMGAKKNSSDGKELNTLTASTVAKALKTNKKRKAKAKDDSE